MRIAPLLLVVCLLLSGCAGAPDPAARETFAGETEATQTLPPDGFYLPPFGSLVPVRAEVTFEVAPGEAIDVWLATGEMCGKFGYRDFEGVARKLNATSGVLDARLPAGDHCLVLDNAGFAMGEAEPSGLVTVRYRIRLWEQD